MAPTGWSINELPGRGTCGCGRYSFTGLLRAYFFFGLASPLGFSDAPSPPALSAADLVLALTSRRTVFLSSLLWATMPDSHDPLSRSLTWSGPSSTILRLYMCPSASLNT